MGYYKTTLLLRKTIYVSFHYQLRFMSKQRWTRHIRRYVGAALMIPGAAMLLAMPAAYAQTGDAWIDDLILQVVKSPYILSDSMIVIQEDTRFFVPVIELAEAMGFAAESEQDRGFISGWANTEDNTFSIDVPRGEYVHKGEVFKLSPDDVMTGEEYDEADDDIYISIDVLNKIWPVTLSVDFSSLNLLVESEEPLPFEAKMEREKKRELAQARKKYAPIRNLDLPLIDNKYKMFSLPAVDFETQYKWDHANKKMTGNNTLNGVMDLLGTSAEFTASSAYEEGRFKKPDSVRLTLDRKSHGDDDLPLGFNEVQGGDTRARLRDLIKTSVSGRGVVATTRSVEQTVEFDRITIEGNAQPNWEIELYRNNDLIDFGTVDTMGEYRFEDVQLQVGNNTIRVVLYGPQGQVEERSENYVISGGMVKPGEFDYEVAAVDADRPLIPVQLPSNSKPQGIASSGYAAYGLNKALTLFTSLNRMPVEEINGGMRNYATVGAMFSGLGGYGQLELYKDMQGGMAIDARYVTEFKGVHVNFQNALYNRFESPDAGYGDNAKKRETELQLNRNFRTGMGTLGLRLDVDNLKYYNGNSNSTISTQQSLGTGGLRVTNQTTTFLQGRAHQSSSGQIGVTSRIRKVSTRASLNYDLFPQKKFTSSNLEVRYTADNDFSAAIRAQRDFGSAQNGAGAQVGYDFGKILASMDVDWLERRGVEMTMRASTSLAPYGKDGSYIMSSDKLSRATPVRARVFLDHDMDGVFGEGDEPLPDSRIQVALRTSDDGADENGYVTALRGGGADRLSSVQVDKTTLVDPYYVPEIPGYNTYPREGTIVDIDLPVIESGAIDGTVSRDDGEGVGGMKLQLVDAKGEVKMETQTAYDGFYTFDFVPIGTYTVRADPSYEVNVPPVSVTVASEELFAYGNDLQLLEQADGGETADDLSDATDSGEVAQPHQVKEKTTLEPAPHSSDGAYKTIVKGVRIGEHPDKVRLVLDLSGPATYEVQAEGDNVVVIDLPDTAWDALKLWHSDTNPVIADFTTHAREGGGSQLRISGRGRLKATQHAALAPADGLGYRLFIDLAGD